MHLNSEEIVDIAEGTRSETTVPHFAVCQACRQQVTDLRLMLTAASEAASEVNVPEPSPLFWDHFSARIRGAVAAESIARRSWFADWHWTPLLMTASVGAVAALLIAVGLSSPRQRASSLIGGNAQVELLSDAGADDDSLTLVTELTAGMDPETAREAGLSGRGSAEHAVTHMSDGELRELRRLLREELSDSGA